MLMLQSHSSWSKTKVSTCTGLGVTLSYNYTPILCFGDLDGPENSSCFDNQRITSVKRFCPGLDQMFLFIPSYNSDRCIGYKYSCIDIELNNSSWGWSPVKILRSDFSYLFRYQVIFFHISIFLFYFPNQVRICLEFLYGNKVL